MLVEQNLTALRWKAADRYLILRGGGSGETAAQSALAGITRPTSRAIYRRSIPASLL